MSAASFRRVFAADVVSTFGSLMSRLALPWLAVLVLDAGPSAMALLAVADVASGALAALTLGVLVDRLPKRRTMIGADLLRAAALLAIPLLAWLGHLSMPVVIAVVAINGALTVAFELAQSAWIAGHTASGELAARNSMLAAGGAVTEAASFSLTGWIFQLAGASVTVIVDAVTYVASAVLLWRVKEAPAPARAPTRRHMRGAVLAFLSEVHDGLRAVAGHPTLRGLALIALLSAFGASFAATTYMIYVARDVGFSTATLGLIFALGGLGSLLGAWVTARLAARVAPARLLVVGLLIWAVGSAAAPAAASAGLLGVLLLCTQQLIGDAGAIAYQITDRTLRQSHAAPALLARVDASIRTVSHGATLAGALISGALAELFGARPLLFASSALIGAAGVAAALALRSRPEPSTARPGATP
jgi:predicted MFS family arabinose efflux permease